MMAIAAIEFVALLWLAGVYVCGVRDRLVLEERIEELEDLREELAQ